MDCNTTTTSTFTISDDDDNNNILIITYVIGEPSQRLFDMFMIFDDSRLSTLLRVQRNKQWL